MDITSRPEVVAEMELVVENSNGWNGGKLCQGILLTSEVFRGEYGASQFGYFRILSNIFQ